MLDLKFTLGGVGTEIYVMRGGAGEEVANIILLEIVRLGFGNRGVKDGSYLYVVNRTIMPAILIECAFVAALTRLSAICY